MWIGIIGIVIVVGFIWILSKINSELNRWI
jgi:hypothetical protein